MSINESLLNPTNLNLQSRFADAWSWNMKKCSDTLIQDSLLYSQGFINWYKNQKSVFSLQAFSNFIVSWNEFLLMCANNVKVEEILGTFSTRYWIIIENMLSAKKNTFSQSLPRFLFSNEVFFVINTSSFFLLFLA